MPQIRHLVLLLALALAAAAFGADHDQSARISAIQSRLAFLGYDPGTPDGMLGRRTEEAIVRFQEAHGLERRRVLHEQWTRALEREATREVQRRLAAQGFDPGPVDGMTGSRTTAAVRAFREVRGMGGSGAIDGALLEALAAAAPAQAPGPTAAAADDARTPALATSPRLAVDDIAGIQRRLAALGHDPGPADGAIGSRTRTAIRAFQKSAGLAETGRVDTALVAALSAAATAPPATAAAASRPAPATLAVDDIAGIQRRLAALGHDPGPADGAMGSRTRTAIRAFQKSAGLAETGRVDTALVRALANPAPANLAGGPAFTFDPVATRIRRVQAQLTLLGHQVGDIDGRMGNRTRTAIRAFQRTQGMPVTGELSQPLFDRLNRVSVRAVQQRLTDAGFSPGRADGNLGPRTRGAIREFEQANGLAAGNGISDALLHALAVAPAPAARPSPGTPASAPQTRIAVRSESGPATVSSAAPGTADTVNGKLSFHDGTADVPSWCAIGSIKLSNEWCQTFSSSSAGKDCSVTLRAGRVVAVRCG